MIFKKKLQVWKSIEDMPAFNWFKLHETNDLAYILINYSSKLSVNQKEKLNIQLQKLTFEFIDAFGISEEYRRILTLQKDIAAYRCERILNNDESVLTLIEIAEIELKDLTKVNPKQNIYQMKAAIEKISGHRINIKEVSVAEYYGYLKFSEESVKNG